MEILAEKEDFSAENRLVLLLGHSNFTLIKRLLTNRWKIVYCTRLKRSASDEDRERIEREMEADDVHGRAVLAELRGLASDKKSSRAANGSKAARGSSSTAADR
jgi:pre-mRNA-splicing helicase BRR2